MKIASLLLSLLAFSRCGLGQTPPDTEAPVPASATVHAETKAGSTMTKSEAAAVAQFQSDIFTHVFGVSVRLDGVIPRAIRAGNPLQLINPFAPPEYGSAFDNVTVDPQSGQANGIRLLGIKF
jgi:hypothetical protein